MVELVIKIAEQDYDKCKNLFDMAYQEGYLNHNLYIALIKSVANGTVLPKGHGDLIDSNILCEQYEKTYGDLCQALDLTPSIIEADEGE